MDAPQELLDLIDAAKTEIDDAKRAEIFDKLQKMLGDLCPAIPVYSPNKMCVMDSNIKGPVPGHPRVLPEQDVRHGFQHQGRDPDRVLRHQLVQGLQGVIHRSFAEES